jgi:hypothetical protein
MSINGATWVNLRHRRDELPVANLHNISAAIINCLRINKPGQAATSYQ